MIKRIPVCPFCNSEMKREDLMLLESLYRELCYVKYERLRLGNLLALKLEVQERLRKIYTPRAEE